MKSYNLYLVALLAFASVTASANRNYGMAGCGLGSVVLGKSGSQIFAATTNYTFINQAFGITFGSLNCTDEASTKTSMQIDHFVKSNNVALATDVSRGNGEALRSVASMLACNDSTAFGSAMQKNFSRIYPNANVDAMSVTDEMINVARENNLSCDALAKI